MTIKVLLVEQFHFKITNDIAIAVDQLGTRKGAIVVYMEPWHMDNRFYRFKENSGEEKKKSSMIYSLLYG